MVPRLLDDLAAISDYLKWQHHFAGLEGFLHDLEGYALLRLAAFGGGLGAIVEVGSFLGRSTAFLAAGPKGAGREKVTAVDHFRGSPENQPGQPYAHPALAEEGTTFPRFQANLRKVGLDDHVTPVVAPSAEAARRWVGPIRLLFIDGDHSYEASRQDFELWSPHVVPRGLVCFHDIAVWPGVTRFYDELLRGPAPYHEVAAVVSLRVLERRPPPALGPTAARP